MKKAIWISLIVLAFVGLTAQINNGGGSFTAGGDLSGTSISQTVVKVNGAAVPASGFGLKTNSSSQFVAAPASFASGTVTAAIAATSLCTTANCPAGTYLITVYMNETGTGCTTVTSGAAIPQLSFIDNQTQTRTTFKIPTANAGTAGYVTTGMTFTTGGTGMAVGTYVVNTNGTAVAGSDSIQISTGFTACATPGSWTGYQVRAFITPVG